MTGSLRSLDRVPLPHMEPCDSGRHCRRRPRRTRACADARPLRRALRRLQQRDRCTLASEGRRKMRGPWSITGDWACRMSCASSACRLTIPVTLPISRASMRTSLRGSKCRRPRKKRAGWRGADKLDQFPEPVLRANQMYVEAFLLHEARRRDGITLRFGWEVTEFGQDADGVTLDAAGSLTVAGNDGAPTI